MRAMRINAKKKECLNAPIGPFTMFSHCVYGYNISNKLISATKNAEGAKDVEYQYQYSTNSLAPNSSTPTLISMSYARMGRRVTKNNQRFVYDGYLCIGKVEDSTSIHYSLSPIHCFVWDPAEPVATRPLMIEKPNVCMLHVTHDGNKNVSELVFFQQANGIAAHYEYAPFGAVTVASRSTPVTAYDFCVYNPFRSSAEYSDNAITLAYYNYRHYDTTKGRWLSNDPLAGENCYRYIYVSNNPLSANDYLGLVEPCPKGFLRRYSKGKVQYRSLIDTDEFKTTNGCGAEGGSSFPNSFINERVVNFRDCCDAHDVCYGTCGRNKLECDHNLGACMRKKCRRLFFMPLAYVLCVGQADIYEVAVAIAGGDAFESAQDKYCVWIDCCPEVYLAPVPQFTMSEVVNGINNFIQTP